MITSILALNTQCLEGIYKIPKLNNQIFNPYLIKITIRIMSIRIISGLISIISKVEVGAKNNFYLIIRLSNYNILQVLKEN